MYGSLAAEKWLYQQLSGSADLMGFVDGRIFAGYAPQATALPFVLVQRTDARDDYPEGPGIPVSMERLTYTIALVGEGESKLAILPAAVAMHEAIQGHVEADLVVNLGPLGEAHYWINCARVGELPNDDLAEPVEGVAYVALGGSYELEVIAAG